VGGKKKSTGEEEQYNPPYSQTVSRGGKGAFGCVYLLFCLDVKPLRDRGFPLREDN